MLRSLYLYTKYFLFTVFSPRIRHLIIDIYSYSLRGNAYYRGTHPDARERQLVLAHSVNWLLRAQRRGEDDGIGSYHLAGGWSASYPETTGYIIPTLLQYASASNDKNISEAAVQAAEWLCTIQLPPGGWQGGRVNEHKPAVVFNTAQVIRGLLPVFRLTRDDKYLDHAVKAGDWLCSIQDQQGTWTKHALMGRARVYDSYVDFPLLMLHRETRKEKYITHAARNLDWIVNGKQRDNGWFEDCDNTIKKNHKPILHTIAYTIDGLLDSGIYLNERKYIEAAKLAADVLREKFDHDGFLHGRYDSNWQGSENMILTGCAQMSVVWQKMAHYSGNRTYADTAFAMNSLLVSLMIRKGRNISPDTLGAVNGSYPLWGRYEPFAFPNWATKYLADALMMEAGHK